MNFPNPLELAKQYHMFLFSGPLVLTWSIFIWVHFFRSVAGKTQNMPLSNKPATPSQLFMFATISLLIGTIHLWGTYTSVFNGLKFYVLESSQITAFRIQLLKNEGEKPSKEAIAITVSDSRLIQESWRQLTNAKSRMRNHEHYADGYLIQLFLGNPPQESNLYLSIFRTSSKGLPDADVVIPHIGTDSQGTINNGGEYRSPEFFDWIDKNVDPLFPK
jgi:hypothetical protein